MQVFFTTVTPESLTISWCNLLGTKMVLLCHAESSDEFENNCSGVLVVFFNMSDILLMVYEFMFSHKLE